MLGGEVGCFRCSSLQRRGGEPCSLGCGFATRGLSPGLFSKRVELCSPVVCLLDRSRTFTASRFAFFAAASSFATSCLAASVSERRCSAAPFDSAAAASCLAAKSAASVAAASSAGMLTATFRRLGGAARLPFLDFLRFNLAFDFAFLAWRATFKVD